MFLFLSSHKYRQRTENDSFPSWSLRAKLVLFLASTLVLSFEHTQYPPHCRPRWARWDHWLSGCNSHQALCSCGCRGGFQTDLPGGPLLALGTQKHPFQGGKCPQGRWWSGQGRRRWPPWMKGSRAKRMRRGEKGGGGGKGVLTDRGASSNPSGLKPGSGGRPPGSASCLHHFLSQWPCRMSFTLSTC